MQTVAYEEVRRRRAPQNREGVDDGPVAVANNLGDSLKILVAEPNPEPGKARMRRDLRFVDRWRGDPNAARLGLSGNALAQLRDVARGLLVMDECLGGVRALRARIIGTEQEEDPVGPGIGNLSDTHKTVVVSPATALMVSEISSAPRRIVSISLRITAQDWGSDVKLSPNTTTLAPLRSGRRSTIDATAWSASRALAASEASFCMRPSSAA